MALFGLVLAACAGPTVESLRDPVPEPLLSRSTVPGYSHIRYWGDNGDGFTDAMLEEISTSSMRREFTATEKRRGADDCPPQVTIE